MLLCTRDQNNEQNLTALLLVLAINRLKYLFH